MLELRYERLEAIIGSTSEADARKTIEEGRRLAGMTDPKVHTIAANAAKRYAETGDMSAALDRIFRAVRSKALPIDPDTACRCCRDGRSAVARREDRKSPSGPLHPLRQSACRASPS